jgi:hypothetical protein
MPAFFKGKRMAGKAGRGSDQLGLTGHSAGKYFQSVVNRYPVDVCVEERIRLRFAVDRVIDTAKRNVGLPTPPFGFK